MNLQVEHSYCTIYLVRHGETDWNVQKKIQGNTDIPLNDTGRKQAHQLKEKLQAIPFSAVVTSNLSRTKETGSIIAGQRTVSFIQDNNLRERSLGSKWEGELASNLVNEISKNSLPVTSREEYLAYKWESDVESQRDVFTRLDHAVKAHAPAHLGSSILFCSHAGVLRAVLSSLAYDPELRWHIDNCAVVTLQADKNGTFSLIAKEGVELQKTAMNRL